VPIAVSIVEDDAAYREALVVVLNGAAGFRCSSAHANAEDALLRLPALAPDVVLVDIQLPGASGIDFVSRLQVSVPKTLPIMLTVYDDAERIFQALAAGAHGYVLKSASPAEILEHLRDVMAGGAPMSRAIARKVIHSFHLPADTSNQLATLTPREREVLDQIATGYTQKEIADQLKVGVETVRSHLKSTYAKLHVNSRAEALAKLNTPRY
jgi:DNA-binding NarL/FixJ family response regulator